MSESSHLPASVLGGGTSPPSEKEPLAYIKEWGPIPGPTAERLGFPSEVESVLIRPIAPDVERAAEAVLLLVPPDVLPKSGDTPASLVTLASRAQTGSTTWRSNCTARAKAAGTCT